MKVKVGDKIYNSEDEPIMLILSDEDKENIRTMHKDCTKFCIAPRKKYTNKFLGKWMDET